VNPDYDLADYEAMIVFDREVMEAQMPKPITNPGGNTKFDPVSYMGDFQFLNVRSLDKASTYYNPDGTKGLFRAVLSHASKPGQPDLGEVILFRRAPQNLGLINPAGEPIT
jgi:hypothetical protein